MPSDLWTASSFLLAHRTCAHSGPWKRSAAFASDRGLTRRADTVISTKSLPQLSRKKDVAERAIRHDGFQRFEVLAAGPATDPCRSALQSSSARLWPWPN